MANSPGRIRWGLALLGGFLVEVGIFAVMLPVGSLFGLQAMLYVVVPTCLILTFLGGWWVGRRAASRFVVHGAVVGAVAALIYIVLTIGRPLPLVYIVSHFVKLAGGMAGGLAAARHA